MHLGSTTLKQNRYKSHTYNPLLNARERIHTMLCHLYLGLHMCPVSVMSGATIFFLVWDLDKDIIGPTACYNYILLCNKLMINFLVHDKSMLIWPIKKKGITPGYHTNFLQILLKESSIIKYFEVVPTPIWPIN